MENIVFNIDAAEQFKFFLALLNKEKLKEVSYGKLKNSIISIRPKLSFTKPILLISCITICCFISSAFDLQTTLSILHQSILKTLPTPFPLFFFSKGIKTKPKSSPSESYFLSSKPIIIPASCAFKH